MFLQERRIYDAVAVMLSVRLIKRYEDPNVVCLSVEICCIVIISKDHTEMYFFPSTLHLLRNESTCGAFTIYRKFDNNGYKPKYE